MQLWEMEEYLAKAKELFPDSWETIDVTFEYVQEGRPVFSFFNICTVYTEDRLISFSMEGSVVQIFKHDMQRSGE